MENLVRVLQVHYENGLCTPPPSNPETMSNPFCFLGLVQIIDDVLLRHKCILKFGVQSEVKIPKYNCYNRFM